MFKKKGFPEKDELVMCTVKQISPNSAFVDLDEYNNIKGMLHITEVALRGVSNIKSYLNTGKTLVCKVLFVKDGVVDVSLKRVNSGARKQKLNEVRISNRFYHLIEHACKEAKTPELTNKIAQSFLDKFNTFYNANEELRNKGLKFMDGVSVPKEVSKPLTESFESLLKQLRISIRRTINVLSKEGDGAIRIKKLLNNIETPSGITIDLTYEGSGKFLINIEAMNYKSAEDFFNNTSKNMIKTGAEEGVMVSFSD